MKQEEYDFNFANIRSKEERITELNRLKEMQAILTGMKESFDNNMNNRNDNSSLDDGVAKTTNRQSSNTKTLSTPAGRAMSNYYQQNGFASAFMLGIISFIFEILFLGLSLFIYR